MEEKRILINTSKKVTAVKAKNADASVKLAAASKHFSMEFSIHLFFLSLFAIECASLVQRTARVS